MIGDLITLVSGLVKGYESEKSKLFDKHVEALKKRIDDIHRDYVQSFLAVKTSLGKKEVPITEMLEFLEQRRYDFLDQRDLAKQLAASLHAADRRIVSPETLHSIENFCGAVSNYFNASNTVANNSWYSDFIRFMKISREHGLESKFFEHNVFGNDPRRDVIEKISVLLDRRLPDAMREVNKYYAELRIALL